MKFDFKKFEKEFNEQYKKEHGQIGVPTGNQIKPDSIHSYNCAKVISYFTKIGIPKEKIKPKKNVFTYVMWKKKGRQVKRGERGLPLRVLFTKFNSDGTPVIKENGQPDTYWSVGTVYHISQTKKLVTEKK